MKKCIITITPVLKNKPAPTVVIDISADDVSVNYPKNAGIKIDSFGRPSQFELFVKMPHDDERLHFRFDNCHTCEYSNGLELVRV